MGSRFLVTGCARSGTGCAAQLFTALGLPCGHEALFNPIQLSSAEITWPESRCGESSWLAGPLLAYLPAGTAVLHQVRSPLSVIRSLVRIRHFELPTLYKEFAEELCPRMAQGDGLERSLRYWWLWNQEVEQGALRAGLPYRRYRVEDLDLELVLELLELVGAESISPERVQTVLDERPKDYNTCGDKALDSGLDWSTMPDSEPRRQVLSLARRFGYETELLAAGAD